VKVALVGPLDLRASVSIARSQGYQSAEEGKARFSAPAPNDATGFPHIVIVAITGEHPSEDMEAAITTLTVAAVEPDPAKRHQRCGFYGSSWRVAWFSCMCALCVIPPALGASILGGSVMLPFASPLNSDPR